MGEKATSETGTNCGRSDILIAANLPNEIIQRFCEEVNLVWTYWINCIMHCADRKILEDTGSKWSIRISQLIKIHWATCTSTHAYNSASLGWGGIWVKLNT